jgi:hypothetical protein
VSLLLLLLLTIVAAGVCLKACPRYVVVLVVDAAAPAQNGALQLRHCCQRSKALQQKVQTLFRLKDYGRTQ